MGGGESPDIDIRFEENAWSKFEIPSRDELLEGAENIEQANCRVDYIITHEPPFKIKGFLMLKDSEAASVTGLNTYLEELSEACRFRRWFSARCILINIFQAPTLRCSRMLSMR